MKRKIIISEKQLIKALEVNEEYLGYFNHEDEPVANTMTTAVETPVGDDGYWGNSEEVFTSHDFDQFAAKQRSLGDLGKSRYSSHVPLVTMEEGKLEENASLDNLNIYAKVEYDNPNQPDEEYSGSERAQEMRRLRAQRNGNEEKADAIDNALTNRRNPIKMSKHVKKDVLGQENAFIKHHTKNTNGTAHTKKNTNMQITMNNN